MPRSAHSSRSANDPSVVDETSITDLRVRGKLPAALSGMYLCIGLDRIHADPSSPAGAGREGMVHSLRLHAGRASYRNRWIVTDSVAQKLGVEPPPGPRQTGRDVVAVDVRAFAGSILAFGDDALAYELSTGLDTVRRVDLAGARRSLTGHAKFDPVTGELHLLTFTASPSQLHVTVSRGGLTRTIRSVDDAPGRIGQFELARDHIVLLGEGFVGLMERAEVGARAAWCEVDTSGRHIALAHAHGDAVGVYATGPSLEQWTLQRGAEGAQRKVLDATPQTMAVDTRRHHDVPHRFLWTAGAGGAHKYDTRTGRRDRHDFGPGRQAGELVFVTDPDRSSVEDGGWLVGLVHDEPRQATDFVVLDAQSMEQPAVAVVTIPRRIADGNHGTWIPATPSSDAPSGPV